MAADHTRLDELRRRVARDPASIAFAPLAEELRRIGDPGEAIRVCRAGLEHHPTYLSARVTLGSALLALQQYTEAKTELEYVLQAAPDNLLALKYMAELRERTGDTRPESSPMDTSPGAPQASDNGRAVNFAPTDPALAELESWHARIGADRAARSNEPDADSSTAAHQGGATRVEGQDPPR